MKFDPHLQHRAISVEAIFAGVFVTFALGLSPIARES